MGCLDRRRGQSYTSRCREESRAVEIEVMLRAKAWQLIGRATDNDPGWRIKVR